MQAAPEQTRSTMDKVVDGAATVGRVQSYFSVAGTTLVCLGGIAVALWLLMRRRTLTDTLKGVVAADPQCDPANPSSCTMQCNYVLDKEYTATLTVSRTVKTVTANGETEQTVGPLPYRSGQTVLLWYDPSDVAGTIALVNDDWRTAGGIVLVLSLFVLGAAWAWFWAVQSYKPLAALQGGATAMHMVTEAFR